MNFFIAFLFIHWIADFIMQTDWMAKNKSKDITALTAHVLVYTLFFGVMSIIMLCFFVPPSLVFLFILVNGILHFVTDYFTSRITAKLWAEQKTHEFFVVVGFDQFLHHLAIWATLVLIIGLK